MNIIKIIGYILAISFGVFMIVYGERDDSPGGQMLGLVMAIAGIWGIVRGRRKSSGSSVD